ncbi:ubiquitin carboxyl-terminal hydrolase [Stagonosporopsis vannaccii]|nr:ubiquitin carboxyl-terminal hydrolase [Stagonosporopsis vannaccii]
MSAQYHSTAQSHAANEQAASTPPSPARRDLVEDADDNFTRKRQRLDDGGTNMRPSSADTDSPSRAITSPHKEMTAMTIREHSPPSPSPAAEPEYKHVAAKSSVGQSPEPTPFHSLAMLDGTRDNSASPPVIEILDDDDDDLSTSITVQLNAEDLFRQFPYHERFGSAVHTLHVITDHVQKNQDIPHDLLPLLAEWLNSLPDDTLAHLQSVYMGKAAFWFDFADLVEKLLKRRYLWMIALNSGRDDDQSRYPFGDDFNDDVAVDEAFSEFFGAYVRLCSQLFLVDIYLLRQPRPEEIYSLPMMSEKHLYHLHQILRAERAPLFHSLRKQHDIDTREMGNRLHAVFLAAKGAQNLLELADQAFGKLPMILQSQIALYMCQILGTLCWTVCQVSAAGLGIESDEYCCKTLSFFRKYAGDLQEPANIVDAGMARELVLCFSSLLQEISQWSESSAESLADEILDMHAWESPNASSPLDTHMDANQTNHQQQSEILPVLIANTWKFSLLRKFIVKGRMELRVMSITFMDEALVKLYQEYNDQDSSDKHPVLKHLADVLLRGRVVDYIISSDSHPQLISRSGNVAGFLVVTDRWVDNQADAIWNIVAHSPDPRMVAATMTMLFSVINLMKPADLLYLCMKLHDLPVESYTPDILRFLRELTTKLLDRHASVDWTSRDVSARPWNVCVRLLQDSAPRIGATKHDLDLNAEVDELLRFIAPSIPESDQQSIFERCLEQINARSAKATGSVKIISIMSTFADTTILQQNGDMVRQIVEELPSFVESEASRGQHRCQLLALQHRLDLLASLACRVGQLIPRELYSPLWDHIVGQRALSNQARDAAWAQLLQAVKAAPDNDFCQQLISTYVPIMDPKYFTFGLYDYVASYNFPLARRTFQIDGVDHSLLQIPGGDLLWSLVLSSPPGTIEELAARDLAVRYTQVPGTQEVLFSEIETAHVELVERCMKELRSGFTAPRDRLSANRQESQMRFSRVLMFLKQMLELVRQKPEFNRGRRADSKVESMDSGIPAVNAITIRYQFANERQSITIAPDRTIADLYRTLCRVTECSKVNLFAGGQKLDVTLRADQTIAEANIGGQLLVQPVHRDETAQAVNAPVEGFSVFETKLVKHFDEMFAWMDADDATSQLLFDFLTLFPYRSTVTNSVTAGQATLESLFPPGKFFQTKYAVQAIHSRLKGQLRSSALDENFLVNAIKLLDRALLSEELIGEDTSSAKKLPLAAVLISAMLDFLRERPSSNISRDYFSDAPALANRLVTILLAAIQIRGAAKFTLESYATILEASLYSQVIWETFWEHPQVLKIHQALLLTDTREPLRQSIQQKILSVCGGHLPSSCPLDTADITLRYWKAIESILHEAVQEVEQSVQVFELAQQVFSVYDEHHRSEETLRSLLRKWSTWLLAYSHIEVPGQYDPDNIVLGFVKLLLCLVPSLKSYKRPLNAGALITSIFQKFLFNSLPPVEITSQESIDREPTSLPILNSNTRRELYDLMLALADDSHTYDRLLRLTDDVENRSVHNVLPNISVDRAAEIRSRTGYVGLYNPRAICYMNSLLAQLFMNLDFRQFMLGLEVHDGNGSQRLLLETQKLFTTMQNSYRKSADPRPFAECVRTLDKTPIDISVQMDADEFYNLLFDQWEAQLVNERDKRRFRNFYGGQMLQQVKSKECKHVSERADSFFALQCDVQGKANLQESLQAFIQGDVMEGDNKYKCESCGGKFVDAVKRTCLKSAPDNLIFHLKRFDFDLTDFSRRKVHEHFAFPQSIDIGLYNVDHLSEPSRPHKADIFDLVGVVVHFGNCENGHYYSYIKKRPCLSGDGSPTWLNFNDEQVDPFDPAEIPQKAFGGVVEDGYTRQYKMYSAYMLFYQRRTGITGDQQESTVSRQTQPPKAQVPLPVRHDIELQNDAFIREYCLFDPHHSAFVRHLHGLSRRIYNGTCSETHEYESRAIDIFLAHLGRIVWRHQTTSIFEEALAHLRRTVLSCNTCCRTVLQWLAKDEEALYNLLLRCPHLSVRSLMRSFLVECLRCLRGKDGYIDITTADNDWASDAGDKNAVLVPIARRLAILAENSGKTTRAWDDLYLLLTQIAELGHLETAALLDAELLGFCLRLFCMHARPQLADGYIDFDRAFQKRIGVFNRLIGFVSTLLSLMDINLPGVVTSDRMANVEKKHMVFPLTSMEKSLLLCWHSEHKAYAVIDKMVEVFDQSRTESFYPGEIVKWLTRSSDTRIQREIATMIAQGISELNNPYCDPYIRVASSYCEAVSSMEALKKICDTVVDTVAAIEQLGDEKAAPSGGDVLRFLRHAFKLYNIHLATTDIHGCLISRSHRFATSLLLYSDESVRDGMHEFIQELYSTYMEEPQHLDQAYRSARVTVSEIIKRIAYELGAGMPRVRLSPLLETGKFLISLLYELDQSEDTDLASFKDAIDKALVYQWRIEVESRVRMLPEVDPLSPGEGVFDASDYGSESDDVELLDP